MPIATWHTVCRSVVRVVFMRELGSQHIEVPLASYHQMSLCLVTVIGLLNLHPPALLFWGAHVVYHSHWHYLPYLYTFFGLYRFFSRENGQNMKILVSPPFPYDTITKMAADG